MLNKQAGRLKINRKKVKEVLNHLMQIKVISEGEGLRMYQDYIQYHSEPEDPTSWDEALE